MRYEAVAVCDRAMARDHLRVGVAKLDGRVDSGEHAGQAAAVGPIDVRIAERAEVIADHDHVGVGKAHQRVAVGVSFRNRNRLHVFAIHVEGQRAAVGDDRQRAPGGCRAPLPGAGCASRLRSSSRAKIVTPILPRFSLPPVWSGCTCVLMRNLIGRVRNLLHRRDDFLGQRRELAVHHEHAVGSGEDADRAALSVEDIEIGRELDGLDLDFAVVNGSRACAKAMAAEG